MPRVQIKKVVEEIYEPFIANDEIIKDNIFDEEIIFKTNNKSIKDYPYLIKLKSREKVFGYTNNKGKISRYSTGTKK
ncbi:hypothetical protein CRV00_12840 [Malaciobacter molluscorum]|uniref:hypothetical protein n=1 Tax=Malaciobacter molluscorum TaxID=1032072 RepID=UPI00100B5800|nr:hypothetical protein [Malaciobacter molluscorum]RXJ92537.1 hypothetical protein CRV00_12840 [Malaciobacter molluscorum]